MIDGVTWAFAGWMYTSKVRAGMPIALPAADEPPWWIQPISSSALLLSGPTARGNTTQWEQVPDELTDSPGYCGLLSTRHHEGHNMKSLSWYSTSHSPLILQLYILNNWTPNRSTTDRLHRCFQGIAYYQVISLSSQTPLYRYGSNMSQYAPTQMSSCSSNNDATTLHSHLLYPHCRLPDQFNQHYPRFTVSLRRLFPHQA